MSKAKTTIPKPAGDPILEKRNAALQVEVRELQSKLIAIDDAHTRTVIALDEHAEDLSEARECISALTKAICMQRKRADVWKADARRWRKRAKRAQHWAEQFSLVAATLHVRTCRSELCCIRQRLLTALCKRAVQLGGSHA